MPPSTRVGVLVLLVVCKAFAYGLSLSAFRGGPVFPSMFIGAALGIAVSGPARHEPGAGDRMGIGAMCAAMLRLPMTSTLLAELLLGSDGVVRDAAGRSSPWRWPSWSPTCCRSRAPRA